MQVLIRLILDDRPGALSHATAAIAEVGGNILGMDIVERDGATVVDDFVVQIDDRDPDELAQLLASRPGVVVECVRSTPEVELHRELEMISSLADDSKPNLDLLARLVPAIIRCDWAVVVSSAGPASVITHASMNGPRIRWNTLPWMPLERATTLDASEDWVPSSPHPDVVTLAAAPIDVTTGILVCRWEGPTFRSREIEHLAQLARLAGRLMQTDTSSSSR